MKKRLALLAGFVVAASIAIAATTGDRLKSPVLVGNGKAVSNSVSFDTGSGSSNAKILGTSTNDINVEPGGSTVMTFLANGDIGIGTTNPQGAFEVDHDIISGNDQYVYSFNSGPPGSARSYVHLIGSSQELTLGTATLDRLTIDSNGVTTLQPTNIGGVQLGLNIVDPGSGTGEGAYIKWESGSKTNAAAIGMISLGTGLGSDLVLYADPTDSGSLTERMRALGAGGISVTGTGGNVPHACTIRTSATAACPVTQSCNAGEILTGGGCASNTTLLQTFPTNSTTWQCGCSGNANAYAICCQQ